MCINLTTSSAFCTSANLPKFQVFVVALIDSINDLLAPIGFNLSGLKYTFLLSGKNCDVAICFDDVLGWSHIFTLMTPTIINLFQFFLFTFTLWVIFVTIPTGGD